MPFAYRYVKYGPSFEADAGIRPPGPVAPGTEERLFANELAVDVGSRCHGWDGWALPVFDHHFPRPVQWPSAAATVLASATALQTVVADRMAEGGAGPGETIWLVTHRDPDLDAFAAMYLARAVLERRIPAAEIERLARSMVWQSPAVSGLSDELRWPLLLAAMASAVDQGWRIRAPRESALHGVLSAARVRGRDLDSTGATEVLDAARDAMCGPEHRNPLTDSLFQPYGAFARELELLMGEDARFRRDLARARRSVVLPLRERFEDWFPAAAIAPFFASPGVVDPVHSRSGSVDRGIAAGVWIRDPESILFKEWARAEGFLFTAIAFSKSRQYFFTLDPEHSGDLHLYDVWARLQAAELRAHDVDSNRPATPRSDFSAREVGYDPWYDGNIYRATIIVTPHAGSALPGGSAPDLSDDPVAAIVRAALEDAAFTGPVFWRDLPLSENTQPGNGEALLDALPDAPPTATFRRAHVRLSDTVAFRGAEIRQQVAGRLWPLLAPTGSPGPESGQVVSESGALVIWSRQGAVVAYQGPEDAVVVRTLLDAFDEFAAVRRDAHGLATRATGRPAERLAAGRRLLERIARLKLTADGPNGLTLGRLMEGSSFEDVISSLHATAELDLAEQTRRADDLLQMILGLGLSVGLVYGFFQIWPQYTHVGQIAERFRTLVFWIGLISAGAPALLVLLNRWWR